ncbi:MAG: histidine ammonia-lyase [Anaerolineales bacterium]
MKTLEVDGLTLTLRDIRQVARSLRQVALHSSAQRRVEQSAARLRDLAASQRSIYGVNTGFGIFSERKIDPAQSTELSENLILSHATGVGPPFPKEVVRAAMLIRANTLAAGYSGVRAEIVETLLRMLNEEITPWVPSQGSLGSSGDLAPLAHMVLVFTGRSQSASGASGKAWHKDDLLIGEEAMRRAGIESVSLGPKEGLALTNGATFTAALLALSLLDAAELMAQMEIAAAMSLEALLGVSQAFDPRLHAARGHPGQEACASRILAITEDSSLLDAGEQIQDAYSLRCIPQIHGPGEELLDFLTEIAIREVNAATDNPLLFGDEVISGGNFHGQPIGLAADYLKLPLAEIGALSERRIFRLTSSHTNRGLPAMLVSQPEQSGLQSGLMMLQYTAASLALENQTLAAADSIRSLPTSGGQEDLNANSTTAARNLRTILDNVTSICAIELVAAAQALDLRLKEDRDWGMGAGTRAAYEVVREHAHHVERDRPLDSDIQHVADAVQQAELLTAVKTTVPDLEGWRLLSE